MKRKTIARLALLGMVAVALAGCGGGGGSVSTPNPIMAQRLEDTFGTQFGVDYRASPNSVPVKPVAGDIVPLSLTTPPALLH
jgi:hypothetical protein